MNKLLILSTLIISLQASATVNPGIQPRFNFSVVNEYNVSTKASRADFTGIAAVYNKGKVMLEWKVQGNEAGNHFELQTSADGVSFRQQAMVFFSELSGTDTYRFKCSNLKQAYRIKIINKDGSETFSRAFTIEQ